MIVLIIVIIIVIIHYFSGFWLENQPYFYIPIYMRISLFLIDYHTSDLFIENCTTDFQNGDGA